MPNTPLFPVGAFSCHSLEAAVFTSGRLRYPSIFPNRRMLRRRGRILLLPGRDRISGAAHQRQESRAGRLRLCVGRSRSCSLLCIPDCWLQCRRALFPTVPAAAGFSVSTRRCADCNHTKIPGKTNDDSCTADHYHAFSVVDKVSVSSRMEHLPS